MLTAAAHSAASFSGRRDILSNPSNIHGEANPDSSAGLPTLSLCTRLVNCAKDAIILQDTESRVLWINRAAELMFGWTIDEVRGFPGASIAKGYLQRTAFNYDFSSSIFDRYVATQNTRKDGTSFWNQQTFSIVDPIYDEQKPLVLVTCRDITEQVETENELRQAKVELQHAAFHDDLTGLANRKRLKTYLESPAVSVALAQQQIGVLQIDLDEFKEINDTLGHAAGDSTLVHVADALRRSTGPLDLACRSGGDEFVLVCPKISSKDALAARAELVMSEICKPMQWQEQTLHIRSSIGASLATPETTSGEALIHQADQALYAAKEAGRSRIMMHSPDLGREQTRKNRLVRDLPDAISSNQFSVLLQPQMRLSDDKIVGCEALLRWDHPDFGQLAPVEFLEIARRSGILADLDYRSMNLSLDALLSLRKDGFEALTLSLNASAEIMADTNYPGLLDWALQSRGLTPRDICIEIKETAFLHSGDYAVTTTVDRLKRMGARIALDDFGTGYAGLAHMSAIDLDEIKLDGELITRLESDPRACHIINALIGLSHRFGMSVVAEGVETPGQLRHLRAANCSVIQGFGLAHPMPAKQFTEWLRSPADDRRAFGDTPSPEMPPNAQTRIGPAR